MPLACLLLALALPAASAEVVSHGRFRVGVDAHLAPQRLPRHGSAPVRFSLAARFIATHGGLPPQLRRIRVAINRHGHLDLAGLPTCHVDQIQPAKSSDALATCAPALVGHGRLSAKVKLPSEAPFPSAGRLLAFNGTYRGHPAILAHVYGPRPVPTSYTIPFLIGRAAHGTYGTTLRASLPHFSSKWGYVTEISLDLGRRFRSHGRRRSYLSAGCPAPKGFSLASFPLARTSFSFDGGKRVRSVVTSTCRVRR